MDRAISRRVFCVTGLGGLYLKGLIHGGAYFRNFTVALWVIETHKLFHHGKVVGVDIKYSDLYEIVHLSLDLPSSCLLPEAECRKGQVTLSF